MKKINLVAGIIIISISIVFKLNGQTGPGGIGEKNGQTTMILWLDASVGILTDASNKVIAWNDLSGYGNHALGNGADNEPDLQTNAINNLPAVKFDGYNDRLRVPGHVSLQPENITILAVVKRTGVSGWGDIISRPYSTSWTTPYTSYTLNSCNAHNMGYNGRYPFSQVAVGAGVQVVNWNPPHGIIPDDQPYIHALAYNYHGNGMGSFLNNGLRVNDDIEIIPASGNLDYNSSTLDVSIGTRSEYQLTPLGDHYLDGEIAEIVMFNYDLYEVEHIIVANYLASKYNISIGWDQYNEISGFTNNVIGLGRENHADQQQLMSNGGNLTLSCSSFPANTSYVFAAHNNGNLQGIPIIQPSGYNNRMSRLWFMESKGTKPETITLTFTLPIKPSSDRNHYGLLYSTDQEFGNPTQIMIANSVNVAEKTITFQVSSTNFVNGFYTIGSKVNHWYGINTDWTDTGNWDGSLPSSTSDIVITGSCSHYPVLTQDATCRTLDIQTGGSITLGNSTLDIYKHFNFSGSAFNSDALGTLRFKGTATSSVWAGSALLRNVVSEKSGARLEILAPINISGNFSILSGTIDAVGMHWYLGGNLTIAESVSTITPGLEITCNGTGNQLFLGNLSFSAMNINNILSTVDITESNVLPTNIFIQNGKLLTGNNTLESISISENGVLELTETLNLKWTFSNNGGNLIHNQQKVVFVLNRNQTVTSDGLTFYDVEVNKTGGSVQLLDQLNIEHDFIISSSGFLPNGKKILFNGNTNQLLTSSGTVLYDVEVHKSNANLTIADDLTISNNLIIIAGSIHTGFNNLTVNGNITNNVGTTGLVINSSESGTGSLINYSGNVSATVERYIEAADWGNGHDGWHFVSSPVGQQEIDATGGWTTEGVNNDYDFYGWSEPHHLWINSKNTTASPTFAEVNGSNNFTPGIGYMAAYQQTGIKQFVGTLNTENITFTGLNITSPTEEQSWHLLGNPYSSALVWNGWMKTGVGSVLQLWNESLQDYSPMPEDEGSFVPAMNGFFVEVIQDNASITIPSNARVHNAQSWYKSTGLNAIKLKVRSEDNTSGKECIIRFSEQSSPEFDPEYDGHYCQGYGPVFYSLAGEDRLSVNTLPELKEELVVPLGFIKNQSNSYVIELSQGLPDHTLYLVDLKTNIVHNISESSYNFSAISGDDPSRFLLRFGPVGIEEDALTPEINAWVYDHNLFVNNATGITVAEVYDIKGSIQYSIQFAGTGLQSYPLNLPGGLYLIRLVNNSGKQTIKANIKF